MSVSIRVESELPSRIGRLVEIGRGEGFLFVDRLVREWETGENRFTGPGELFLAAYLDGSIVGFGGLTRDPYCQARNVGRIRHVYVEPTARRQGIGGTLVRELVARARPSFAKVRLSTQQAASFYEHLGFLLVAEEKATHALTFPRTPTFSETGA